MKKGFFSCVAVVILMLVMSAGSVFAADEATKNSGFYVGVSGGYVMPQNLTTSNPDNSSAPVGIGTLKNGYLAGVTVGWLTPFTKRILAMELEYNYIFGTDYDKDTHNNETITGTINIHSLLFNLKARYPEGRFHPYAGFGVGYSYFQVGDMTEGSISVKGDSGSAVCYQILTGLDFDITSNLGVGIGYKYFATKPTVGSANSNKIYADFDYAASVVTVGLTYTF